MSLEHILSSSEAFIPAYTWSHSQVLRELAEDIHKAVKVRRESESKQVNRGSSL